MHLRGVGYPMEASSSDEGAAGKEEK